MPSTAVRVSLETKKRLATMKRYPRETFDDVIRRRMDTAEDDELLSDETIRGIEESLEDIRAGKYRAILNFCDDMFLIVVVEVGHRSKVYRKTDPAVLADRFEGFKKPEHGSGNFHVELL